MIKLTVNSDGQPCLLKKGSAVQIKFASADMEAMQLFDGKRSQDGNMVWEVQNNEEVFQIQSIDVNEWEEDNKPKLVFLNNLIRKFERTVYYPKAAEQINAQGKVVVEFFIDNEGNIRSPRIIDSPNEILSQAVVYALKSYPRFIPTDYDYLPINQPIALPVNFQFEKGQDLSALYPDSKIEEEILAINVITKKNSGLGEAGYNSMIGSVRSSFTTGNSSVSAVFNSTNLGWINCDRFIKPRKLETIYVICDDQDAADVFYYMVFKDIRSILPGATVVNEGIFHRVPSDKDVTIIGLKMIDDEIYLATAGIKTGKTKEISLKSFAKTSHEELVRTLNTMEISAISMR